MRILAGMCPTAFFYFSFSFPFVFFLHTDSPCVTWRRSLCHFLDEKQMMAEFKADHFTWTAEVCIKIVVRLFCFESSPKYRFLTESHSCCLSLFKFVEETAPFLFCDQCSGTLGSTGVCSNQRFR